MSAIAVKTCLRRCAPPRSLITDDTALVLKPSHFAPFAGRMFRHPAPKQCHHRGTGFCGNSMEAKQIALTTGGFTIVDAGDFDELNRFKWYRGEQGYAQRGGTTSGKKTIIRLHRVLLKPAKGQWCDHINRNKLDNRRSNLRLCLPAENLRNTRRLRTNTSGVKGVSLNKRVNRYEAYIDHDGKRVTLGHFDTLEEATSARVAAAKEYHKEFACHG